MARWKRLVVFYSGTVRRVFEVVRVRAGWDRSNSGWYPYGKLSYRFGLSLDTAGYILSPLFYT